MQHSTSLLPLDINSFPDSYISARKRWLAKLELLRLEQYYVPFPCVDIGQDHQNLITDTVWLGSTEADNVLILLAGTHGVEGFAGSAVQLDYLRMLAAGCIQLNQNTAILLIHALTPWGYALLRRCDANGVDLNRNAIGFTQPLPVNPGYEALQPAFNTPDPAQRAQIFVDWENRYGRKSLEIAISAGQYTDPNGPFYGGKAPAHGNLVCEQLIQDYQLAKRNLAVIDIHTGLGPYGYGEIICDHAPDSDGAAIAKSWYGDAVTLPELGTSSSVPKFGLLDFLWHKIMNNSSCYITLEFGTYRTEQLFEVLLQDHQLWAQSANTQSKLEHGFKMRRHFCPDDDIWKEMVLFRARQVLNQALSGLTELK